MRQHFGNTEATIMDLKKMNPMARKMSVHTEALNKALETGDAFKAKEHLSEVLKFAGFLNEDIHSAIRKSEDDESKVSIVSNPVQKMNETGRKFDVSQRDRVLPGTIISARVSNGMRPHYGTFGRYTKQ